MIVLPETRGEYKYDYNIAPLTWFKVGGHASVLYKPADIDDLSYFLKNYDHKLPIFTLGAGSNIIIRDGGVNGIVIKLGRNFTNIEILDDNRIRAGAGNLNYNLAQFCLQNSIKNFEFLIGIPGTIGGGIAMNAGSYGAEFKDIIEEVKYLDKKGNIHIIKCKDIGFGYRHNNLPEDLIFVEAIFHFEKGDPTEIKAKMDKISEERKLSQPVTQKTGGSTFANPEGHKAWQLIDEAGMRGHIIGGAQVSPMHCNFMINMGNATATDLESLGDLVRKKVLEKSGIDLHWEIKRIGSNTNSIF